MVLSTFAATSVASCSEPVSRLPVPPPVASALPTAEPFPAAPEVVAEEPVAEEPVAEEEDGPVVPPSELPQPTTELAKALGPTGLRTLEVASSLCGAAVRRTAKGVAVGCRSCPPFTKKYGPDGTIGEVAKGDEFYELEHVTYGAFSRAGADEVAATFSGCEPYAGNYGGTMLAARKAPGSPVWVAQRYYSGAHPSRCEPLALRDGRQLLVCKWTTGKQTTSHFLLVYDFEGPPEEAADVGSAAFELADNSFSMCLGAPPGYSVTTGDIDRFTIVPSPDAVGKVLLDVRFGAALPTKAFAASCQRVFDSDEAVDITSWIPTRKHRLALIWNGSSFVLDPPSAARWKAAQPKDPPEE